MRGWGKLVSKAANDHSANLAVGLTVHNLSDNADIRRGRHVVYDLHTHLVFVTKYRRDALSELAICDLRTIFTKVCKDFEAACCVNGGQRSMRATRTVCSGPHPTASRHAPGRPCRHSQNTSNPSGNHHPGPLAYLPGLNAGVSREEPDEIQTPGRQVKAGNLASSLCPWRLCVLMFPLCLWRDRWVYPLYVFPRPCR